MFGKSLVTGWMSPAVTISASKQIATVLPDRAECWYAVGDISCRGPEHRQSYTASRRKLTDGVGHSHHSSYSQSSLKLLTFRTQLGNTHLSIRSQNSLNLVSVLYQDS